jgi:formate hydrogenlyase transcriptional activator
VCEKSWKFFCMAGLIFEIPFVDANACDCATQKRDPVRYIYSAVLALRSVGKRSHMQFSQDLQAYRTPAPGDEFSNIVGRSEAMREVLDQVRIVAPADSTVLIEGETGTGKEAIASAIHARSARQNRPFVKVNCAAIPLELLESELFGHEKGAFTGAVMQRIGRFEAANGGTLLLDEIGDMPLALQAKLLRVLQDHQVERLGSARTQRLDVRIVASTNRDLARLVTEEQFRMDLYYRLNVFPIVLPPLRRRVQDIPFLVAHFADHYSCRMSKQISKISGAAMESLIRYPWPGNIRELQNVIERSVILTSGDVLQVSGLPSVPPSRTAPVTLEEAVRDHILKALEESNWVIGGKVGAAARLGVKRTTLMDKMRRRGLVREKGTSIQLH